MAVSSIDEAKAYLYRQPWVATDVDDPVEIITGLLREALIFQKSSEDLRKRIGKVEAKVAYLTEIFMQLAYNPKAVTKKKLSIIHQRLAEIENS